MTKIQSYDFQIIGTTISDSIIFCDMEAENEEEYQKSQARLETFASTLSAGAGEGGGNPGPNNPEMMQWMAGYYYSYTSAGMGSSSGTERKIMLCPDGTFQIATESGYSG